MTNNYLTSKEVFEHIKPFFEEHGNKMMSIGEALKEKYTGPGCGLSTGFLQDEIYREYVKEYSNLILGCSDNSCLEADFILILPLSSKKGLFSMKKTFGGDLALAWQKNPNGDKREFWKCPIVIFNHAIPGKTKRALNFGIKKGIYVIDHIWCRSNIKLSKNNKTDNLIKRRDVIKMLKNAKTNNTFWEFDETKKVKMEIKLLNAIKFLD